MAMPRQPLLRVGSVLRTRRSELGISQLELAHRARVSARTVQEIERNAAANPTLETLDRLAEGLHMTLTEIVERLIEEDADDDLEEDS